MGDGDENELQTFTLLATAIANVVTSLEQTNCNDADDRKQEPKTDEQAPDHQRDGVGVVGCGATCRG